MRLPHAVICRHCHETIPEGALGRIVPGSWMRTSEVDWTLRVMHTDCARHAGPKWMRKALDS